MRDNTNEHYQLDIFERKQVTAFEVCDKAEKQEQVTPEIRIFFPKVPKPVYRKTGKYSKFIGKTFKTRGFSRENTLKIIDIYGGRNPAFRCQIIDSPSKGVIGQRENFLCKSVVRSGELIKSIKILGA